MMFGLILRRYFVFLFNPILIYAASLTIENQLVFMHCDALPMSCYEETDHVQQHGWRFGSFGTRATS